MLLLLLLLLLLHSNCQLSRESMDAKKVGLAAKCKEARN
jgi:hypothetical protein